MRPRLGIASIALAFALSGCGGEPAAPAADGAQASAPTGASANLPPRITSVRFDPAEPRSGDAVRAVVAASDPDGDPVKLVYHWSLRGAPTGAGTARLALEGAARGDGFGVTVVASDGRAESAPFALAGEVGNQPPRVERLTVEPATHITAGMPLRIRPEGSDEDGDALTFQYAWSVNGEPVEHEGAEFDTSPLTRGDVVRVDVRAHDGRDLSEPLSSPDFQVVNRPPRVVSTPDRSPLGGGFHYRVEVVDPDGDQPLRFELEDPPAGMRIGAVSGEIDWRPTDSQAGRHTVRVIVDDLKGGRIAHAFDVNVAGNGAASGSGT